MSLIIRKTPPRSLRRRITRLIEREREHEEKREKDRLARFLAAQSGNLVKSAQASPRVEPRQIEDLFASLANGERPTNLSHILPLIFNLDGKPFHLEHHFPFESFYATHCSKQMVFKTARQTSKCRALSDTAPCYGANGRPLYGEELQVGRRVLGIDPYSHEWVSHTILDVHQNPPEPVFEIRSALGSETRLTGSHPLLTVLGMSPLASLTTGDIIGTLHSGGEFGVFDITDDNMDSLISSLVTRINGVNLATVARLPEWVFDLPRHRAARFLASIWASLAHAHPSEGYPTNILSLTSERVVRDLRALLSKFGILSSVLRNRLVNGSPVTLCIEPTSLQDFLHETRLRKIISHPAASIPSLPVYSRTGDVAWDRLLFRRELPAEITWDIETDGYHNYVLDGLVVHNSTNQAVQSILMAQLLPYFHTLFVMPLFETVRRFSTNYVKPFIEQSPVKSLMTDSSCVNGVLQRSFRNRSNLYFSYAFTDCDRIRGLSVSKVVYDEVQDLDYSFVPVIAETMSASRYGLSQFTGTPKTLDNTIEQIWLDSSQAEWVIRCEHCRHHNIPSLEFDLEAMMGPYDLERKVSRESPGVCCAKCGKPINPRTGWWDHKHPKMRYSFPGRHVPQIIMPMHYEDTDKWAILQGKRMGFGRTPKNTFYNEVCGESYDTGAKLVSSTDLKRAAVLPENTMENALKQIHNYRHRILSVDWGGGGQDEISFTTVAMIGLCHDGRIEIPFGWRSLTPNDPMREALAVLHFIRELQCAQLVHDGNGAGALRSEIIRAAGLPQDRICTIAYQRTMAGGMMRWVPFNDTTGKEGYYLLDKARSLQYTCELIKNLFIRFFAYDFKGPSNAGLLHDFLSLVEDNVDSRQGQGVFTIIRNKTAGPDDFAHAVNMGCCAMFEAFENWPDVGDLLHSRIDLDFLNRINPVGDVDWTDL